MKRQSTKYIVVHASATRPNQKIDAADIDRMHKKKGWKGIGYHLVITREGLVQKGRDLDAVGAHVYGYNKVSVGVCMVGGLDYNGSPENNYTGAQFAQLAETIKILLGLYPGAEVVGHRDLSPDIDGDGVIEPFEWLKACPCFDVRKWMKDELQAAD